MQTLNLIVDELSYPVLAFPGRPKSLLDRTVAKIYQVETREINQAVKNNPQKFPGDFYFQLTDEETEILKSKILISNPRAFNRSNPSAFSWEGCNMLATILKSEVAIERSLQIIRGFTALERENADNISLAQGRVIASLAAEMYKNRQLIGDLAKQFEQLS